MTPRFRRRRIWIILGSLGLLILLLREAGPLDVSYYAANTSSMRSVSKSSQTKGGIKQFGYDLALEDHKVISTLEHRPVGCPTLGLYANLQTEISGNAWIPFSKHLKATYYCPFRTVKGPEGCRVWGEVKGEVETRILGVCSHRKALEVVNGEVRKEVEAALNGMIGEL